MRAISQGLLHKGIKKGALVFLFVLIFSIIIAVCQSRKFASSLWVIAQFGLEYWQEHISRTLDNFWVWATISGLILAGEALASQENTGAKKRLVATAANFSLGFAAPYAFILIVTIVLYAPLGILSFIFPDQIAFFSMGFAFLCAMYIIFMWIAIDTPPFLFEVIKKARLYFKLLAAILALYLAVQIFSTILSIVIILTEYSVWRVYLPAYIIALGGALIVTVLINFILLRKDSYVKKIWMLITVYLLSILTGNISQSIFHWGEYPSALAAVIAPVAYSFLLIRIRRDIFSALSAVAGLFGGLGTGLAIANLTGLKIIAQEWPGLICGSAIALGFGISFGFILGPRIGELFIHVLNVKRKTGIFITIGFVVGVMVGMVVGGFLNRQPSG